MFSAISIHPSFVAQAFCSILNDYFLWARTADRAVHISRPPLEWFVTINVLKFMTICFILWPVSVAENNINKEQKFCSPPSLNKIISRFEQWLWNHKEYVKFQYAPKISKSTYIKREINTQRIVTIYNAMA